MPRLYCIPKHKKHIKPSYFVQKMIKNIIYCTKFYYFCKKI